MWRARIWGANGAMVAAVAVGVLGLAGVALASNQVKGARYSGQLAPPKTAFVVSFKVSGNGKRVTGLTISDTPFYCEGGGRATPVAFANASISKSGAFTSTGKYTIPEGPYKGQTETLLKITGKFTKGGKEQGTVTSTYPKSPTCSGKSSYATKKG
jgi:hypothetical protein